MLHNEKEAVFFDIVINTVSSFFYVVVLVFETCEAA